MGRPPGVTASAVVAIIGSAMLLLTGVIMSVGMSAAVATRPGVGPVIVVMAVIFVAFAGLGIASGAALLKLRPWARIATLVFAGFMSVFSAFAIVAILAVPTPPSANAQELASFDAMRPFFAVIYAIPLGIGVWWLVYFNMATTKAAFAAPYVAGEPPTRPLSISIIGWLSVMSGVIMLPLSLTRIPAFVAGFVITGLPAALVYAFLGGAGMYLGWSVLKLNEIGRRFMIGWYVLTMGHSMYVALVPSVRARMDELQQSLALSTSTAPPPTSMAMTLTFTFFGVALGLVAIWFLVKERARFS